MQVETKKHTHKREQPDAVHTDTQEGRRAATVQIMCVLCLNLYAAFTSKTTEHKADYIALHLAHVDTYRSWWFG